MQLLKLGELKVMLLEMGMGSSPDVGARSLYPIVWVKDNQQPFSF